MYNLAIVGTSFIAEELVKASNYLANLNCYAVYSRTRARGEEFAAKVAIDHVFNNYEQMLQDSTIDIIYIATPNSLHYEQATKAIKAGKHVLIEKPITIKTSHIDKLYELAKQYNVFIMEAYVSLTYNTFEIIKQWIERLEHVSKVDFHLEQQTRHFDDYLDGKSIPVFENKMGGGALRDLGPYCLYPLVSFFGAPMQTHYFSTKNETGADETTLALSHYEQFTATISVSKMYSDTRPSIISGDAGYIQIDNINSFQTVSLYDPKGRLLQTVEADYKHRMLPQLEHFITTLDSNNFTSAIYTQSLACDVSTIIAGNYLS